jgi:hypothetical protein
MRMIAAALAVLTTGCFEDAPPIESDTGDGGTTHGSMDASATATNDASDDAPTADDDADDDDDDDSTNATDPTAPGECPPDSVCVPAIPTAWLGPVAFTVDALGTPSCAGAYPLEVEQLHAVIEEDASTCGCSCDGPLPGCTGSIVTYGDVGCEGDASMGVPADPGECTGIVGADPSIGVLSVGGVVQACEALGTEEIGAWSWANDVAVCAPAEPPSACGDGVCAPLGEPSFRQLCIYREGDHPCPDEEGYGERQVFHADVDDTRACTECACTIAAPNCAPQLWLSDDIAACGTPDGPFMMGCVGIGPSHIAAYWEPLDPGGCSPERSVLEGAVTPTGTATVCCTA